jgi:hypothetical protein
MPSFTPQIKKCVSEKAALNVVRRSFASDLNPITLRGLKVPVFCAGIPFYAASYVVRFIELAHFSPHGLAVQILNDHGEPLSPVL